MRLTTYLLVLYYIKKVFVYFNRKKKKNSSYSQKHIFSSQHCNFKMVYKISQVTCTLAQRNTTKKMKFKCSVENEEFHFKFKKRFSTKAHAIRQLLSEGIQKKCHVYRDYSVTDHFHHSEATVFGFYRPRNCQMTHTNRSAPNSI